MYLLFIGSFSLESPDQFICYQILSMNRFNHSHHCIILVQDTKSCHLGYYCFLLTGLPFLTGFDISYTCPSIDYSLHSSQRGYLKHKSDLVTHLLNNLQGFPITFRIKSKVLILAYKTIHDLGSSILCNLLPFSQILHPPYFSLCLPSMLLNVPP